MPNANGARVQGPPLLRPCLAQAQWHAHRLTGPEPWAAAHTGCCTASDGVQTAGGGRPCHRVRRRAREPNRLLHLGRARCPPQPCCLPRLLLRLRRCLLFMCPPLLQPPLPLPFPLLFPLTIVSPPVPPPCPCSLATLDREPAEEIPTSNPSTKMGGREGGRDRWRAVRIAWENLVRWSWSWESKAKSDVLEQTKKVVVFGGGSFGMAMAAHVVSQKAEMVVAMLVSDVDLCRAINETCCRQITFQ